MTPALITTSEIRCDTHGCSECIRVYRDLGDAEAAAVALSEGWGVRSGLMRDYHWCARHCDHPPHAVLKHALGEARP